MENGAFAPQEQMFLFSLYFKKSYISKASKGKVKLEDLKVLRRSPDLHNNVKIGQGQLQLIMEQILFLNKNIHFGQVT